MDSDCGTCPYCLCLCWQQHPSTSCWLRRKRDWCSRGRRSGGSSSAAAALRRILLLLPRKVTERCPDHTCELPEGFKVKGGESVETIVRATPCSVGPGVGCSPTRTDWRPSPNARLHSITTFHHAAIFHLKNVSRMYSTFSVEFICSGA